jgi:hypothetical protein
MFDSVRMSTLAASRPVSMTNSEKFATAVPSALYRVLKSVWAGCPGHTGSDINKRPPALGKTYCTSEPLLKLSSSSSIAVTTSMRSLCRNIVGWCFSRCWWMLTLGAWHRLDCARAAALLSSLLKMVSNTDFSALSQHRCWSFLHASLKIQTVHLHPPEPSPPLSSPLGPCWLGVRSRAQHRSRRARCVRAKTARKRDARLRRRAE